MYRKMPTLWGVFDLAKHLIEYVNDTETWGVLDVGKGSPE